MLELIQHFQLNRPHKLIKPALFPFFGSILVLLTVSLTHSSYFTEKTFVM